MRTQLGLFLAASILMACSNQQKTQQEEPVKSQAQQVIDEAISFHGMEGLSNADFSLKFRDMDYTYSLHNGMYEYTRTQTDSLGREVIDRLTNEGLIRYIEGDTVSVEDEKRAAYARSVNSVIYFFRLPFGLNDPAVVKKYQGTTTIKGKDYHEVRITFQQSGGGEDFDDVFLYWFDTDDYSMDYMAYLYHTDGGGMRFREAINPRRNEGILIQDYINFKPVDEKMDINNISELYEAGELEELSRIINENVSISTGH
ncbi:DUF6503 family protein [Roseivirga sp.]|uniref:DUF6503 family protein n=1 Tax=Roseivirga sp. TaxID=1964215 RepID=UPI003B52FC0E